VSRRDRGEELQPLDAILGTLATVRVLRVLQGGDVLSPPYIARKTSLSRPAVRDALIRLERARVIERVGQGRNVLYRLGTDHPLSRRIVKLFRAEARRAVVLLACLAGLLASGARAHAEASERAQKRQSRAACSAPRREASFRIGRGGRVSGWCPGS